MADLLTPATTHAVKINGTILDFDTTRKTVKIRSDKGKLLRCYYDPSIEEQIEDALNFNVEAKGHLDVISDTEGKKTSRVVINRIAIGDLDFASLSLKRRTIQDLLNSSIVGMWQDRTDLDDDFVRRLRE
jgi:hypothetical protein